MSGQTDSRGRQGRSPAALPRVHPGSAGRLRELVRRLMHAEEEERRRLGRELHDTVGGDLSALGIGLELLRKQLPEDPDAALAGRIEDLEGILRETMANLRAVLADLRPTALDELGLVAALRHQAEVLSARGDIRFIVAGSEPAPRLTPACEIAVYRIAQEAWANAMKHSGAQRVALTITQGPAGVTMVIEDDGRGLPPGGPPAGTPGLGLTTMRERAEAIGAVLQVRAAAGGGVGVRLALAAAGNAGASR